SSRSEGPVLPHLWQWPVLLRLTTVLTTMIVVRFLVCWWGHPLPYRVGEVYPTDLRVRAYFEVVSQPQTEQTREAALKNLSSSEAADPQIREAVRRSVPLVVEKYQVDTPLVRRGQPITAAQLTLLQEEHRTYQH